MRPRLTIEHCNHWDVVGRDNAGMSCKIMKKSNDNVVHYSNKSFSIDYVFALFLCSVIRQTISILFVVCCLVTFFGWHFEKLQIYLSQLLCVPRTSGHIKHTHTHMMRVNEGWLLIKSPGALPSCPCPAGRHRPLDGWIDTCSRCCPTPKVIYYVRESNHSTKGPHAPHIHVYLCTRL